MKFFSLILGISLFSILTSTAQSQRIDVYKYANLNDPIFQKNVRLCKQEEKILYSIYQKGTYPNAEESKSIQALRDQHDKNWESAGLSPILVQDKDAKAKLEDEILTELKHLAIIIKQKGEAVPYYASSIPQTLLVKRRLAAFDEIIKKTRLQEMAKMVRVDRFHNTKLEPNNSNLESEFLAEIAKINSDIAEINSLALNRQIIKSFNKSQILCDKLRRYQGDQYFSRTLKKIRKENPGFSFSITPLAEQVTPEYWMEMRGRANIAYRKAVEAYSGLVWNEGIQTFTANVEIPFRFVKATYDLVTNFKSLFDGKLWGSIDAIRNSYGYQDNAVQLFQTASKEAFNAGEDAKDWKSYIGVAGGLLSAVNGYKQTFDLVRENVTQNGLIKANRETVEQLKKRSKNLLQQFDRYRAYIDSHLSSIDCLNDRITRIDLDNKSIKGDKITIWGTGLYDWDVDVYVNQIKEAGEDLKNEYIYCEDFIKALQIAYAQAEKNYHTINDKAKSSGAVQYQIDNVLSQNETNYDWFDEEVSRLAEMYTQFCEDENNTYPDDVIIVSNQVIPGVEEQDGNPNNPPVWEYEDEEDYEPTYNQEQDEPEQNNNINNNNNTSGGNSVPGIISKGNGWSAQKIENNPAAIQNDINNAINSGKTPSGIYISDGHEVLVYYIEGNPLGMTAWKLEDYNDATSLQNGITSNIEQAYFPMGISFTNQGDLYVLFIKSEVSVTAWQLVESQLDLNAVSANMQPYLNQQYVPVGITIYNGMYYTLMTQIPDTKITNWTIEGYQYDNNAIMQNVNTKINSGLIPFGYLKEENIVNILYVGF